MAFALRTLLLACVFPLVLAPVAHATKLKVAVTYFDDHSKDAKYAQLSKGIAAMMITDLSVSPNLVVVERTRLNEVLKELKLSSSAAVNPKTAAKMGKLLGADLILTGSFVSLAPKMRIDARFVNVETGTVVATAKAEGAIADFFKVEAQLVARLLTKFGVPLAPMQKMQIDKPPTRNLEAMRDYSLGLDAADRGDTAAEKKALRRAVKADPAFAWAKKRLAALEKRVDKLERAGGLILKPTTAMDHWSNYKILRDRGEKAKSLASVEAALKLAPTKIDILERLVRLRQSVNGALPTAAKMSKRFKVNPLEAGAIIGIVSKNAELAAQASAALVSKAPQGGVAQWLRARALGPQVNPKPTALERADEWSALLRVKGKVGLAELSKRFIDPSAAKRLLANIAKRVAHYKEKIGGSWGVRRGELVLPPVQALVGRNVRGYDPKKGQDSIWVDVRIAEVRSSRVQMEIAGTTLSLKWESAKNLKGEGAVYTAQLPAETEYKAGVHTVMVRFRDGKGRQQQQQIAVWHPPKLTFRAPPESGAGARRDFLRVRDFEGREGAHLVDPVARVWTRKQVAFRVDFRFLESRMVTSDQFYDVHARIGPLATGQRKRYSGQGVDEWGFQRSWVYAYTDGKSPRYGVLGRTMQLRVYKPQKGSQTTFFQRTETLARERAFSVFAMTRQGAAHLAGLLTAGHYKEAVNLTLDLRLAGSTAQAWRAVFDSPAGAYHTLYMLAAARRIGHRYAELRKVFAHLHPSYVDAAWIGKLVAFLDRKLSWPKLLAAAQSLDRGAKSTQWRYRAEALVVAILGDAKGLANKSTRALVLEALVGLSSTAMETEILIALEREYANRVLPVVGKVGSFFMDRHEVSVADYQACVGTGRCQRLSTMSCYQAYGGKDLGPSLGAGQGTGCLDLEANPYPVTDVTQVQAARYCKWRGGSLPTAAQWGKAASGTSAFADRPLGVATANLLDDVTCGFRSWYPKQELSSQCRSGAVADKNRWDRYAGLAPSGVHPVGRTKAGLEHLVGNAREWLAGAGHEVAGCSHRDAPNVRECAARHRPLKTFAALDVGFRCVYRSKPAKSARAQGRSGGRKSGGKPSVSWVSVAGGELVVGEPGEWTTKPIKTASASALAAQAIGATAADVTALVEGLRKLGQTGTLSARLVQELATRARWRKIPTLEMVKRFFAALQGDGDLTSAGFMARNERIKKQLGLRFHAYACYRGAAKTHKVKEVSNLSEDQRRAALYNCVRATLVTARSRTVHKSIQLARPGRLFSCMHSPRGECDDSTGLSGDMVSWLSAQQDKPAKVASFKLMKTEVTQAMFGKATGYNPSFPVCPNCPVSQVTWAEAQSFCKAIGGRLPTHVEWEYAARGASKAVRYGPAGAISWNVANSGGRAHPVGKKKPNRYGAHGMLGGVWEWVADNPSRRGSRVVMGGSWASDAMHLQSPARSGRAGHDASSFIGFRCAK